MFVLTHHARDPLKLKEGRPSTSRLAGSRPRSSRRDTRPQAKTYHSPENKTARQYLVAGLVDEMEISFVPILLGSGERLFDGVEATCTVWSRAHGRDAQSDSPQVRETVKADLHPMPVASATSSNHRVMSPPA